MAVAWPRDACMQVSLITDPTVLALTMPTVEKPAAHDQHGGASMAGGGVKAMMCDRHVLIFLVRIRHRRGPYCHSASPAFI
jgi:hypothetical protein